MIEKNEMKVGNFQEEQKINLESEKIENKIEKGKEIFVMKNLNEVKEENLGDEEILNFQYTKETNLENEKENKIEERKEDIEMKDNELGNLIVGSLGSEAEVRMSENQKLILEDILKPKIRPQIVVPTVEIEKAGKETNNFVAIYSYKDGDGVEKYQIVKTVNGKQPYYCRTLRKNGEYVYGIPKSISYIPYRLELFEGVIKEENLIFIVEGESKVETLIRMGFLATTAPFKGTNKWNSYYSKFLEGFKAVIIIADNDENGEEFAVNAMDSIKSTLDKTEVGIVRINEIYSNIKEGGDISDLVEIFGEETVKLTLESIISQF